MRRRGFLKAIGGALASFPFVVVSAESTVVDHASVSRDDVAGGKIALKAERKTYIKIGDMLFYDKSGVITTKPQHINQQPIGQAVSSKDADGYVRVYIDCRGRV